MFGQTTSANMSPASQHLKSQQLLFSISELQLQKPPAPSHYSLSDQKEAKESDVSPLKPRQDKAITAKWLDNVLVQRLPSTQNSKGSVKAKDLSRSNAEA